MQAQAWHHDGGGSVDPANTTSHTVSYDLNSSSRLARTRMLSSVAGAQSCRLPPMPIIRWNEIRIATRVSE